MQINFAAKEVVLKLVYYGPAMSGKTSNLQALHDCAQSPSKGRLMSLATKDDRTLFFDMLPIAIKGADGMSLRLKIFTVPGQTLHASTRKFVLQGADGVAFVADSQIAELENNATSFRDLRENLKELGKSIKEVPLVIQFNKRDLPNIRTDAELGEMAKKGREPVFAAVAFKGEGVVESFLGLLILTCRKLDAEHQLSQKVGMNLDELTQAAAKEFGYEGDLGALAQAVGGNK